MATRFLVEFELRGGGGGTRQVEGELRSLETRAGSTATAVRGIGTAFALLGGTTAVVTLVRRAMQEATAAEESVQRMNQALATSGRNAGVSAGEIEDFASRIQRVSRISDDAARDSATALLKYSNVQGDIYRRALQISADIASQNKRNAAETAAAVGRLLEAPGKGMRAAAEAGIVLSEGQQAALSEILRTSGAVAAQDRLLSMLEIRFRGAAEAAGRGYAGAIAQAKNASSDLLETLGGAGAGRRGLIGALEELLRSFTEVARDEEVNQAVRMISRGLVGVIHVVGLVGNAVRVIPMFFAAVGAKSLELLLRLVAGASGLLTRFANSVLDWVRDKLPGAFKRLVPDADDLFGAEFLGRAAERQAKVTQFFADRVVGAITGVVGHAKALWNLFGDGEESAAALGRAADALGNDLGELDTKVRDLLVDAARMAVALEREARFRREVQALYRSWGLTLEEVHEREEALSRAHEVESFRLEQLAKFADLGAEAAARVAGHLAELKERELEAGAGADKAKKQFEELWRALEAMPTIEIPGVNAPGRGLSASARDSVELMVDVLRQYRAELLPIEERIDAQIAKLRELSDLFPVFAKQIEAVIGALEGDKWARQWLGLADALEGSLSGVSDELRGVASGMAQIIRGFVQARREADLLGKAQGWATIAQGIFAIAEAIGLLRQNTTAGGFGGRGEGNYSQESAAIGAVIGGIIGGIAGAGAFSVAGAAAGMAIGSAVGGIVGSFIKKGAQEALGTLKLDSGDIVAAVTKNEGSLGRVITELGQRINEALQGLLDVLGAEITGIPAISMKVRDGIISVWVGAVNARVEEMDDAIAFAVTEVLKQADITGLSQTMRTVLANTKALSIDQLGKDLEFGQWYERLGLRDVATGILDAVAKFRTDMRRAADLGLDQGPIVANFIAQMKNARDQLLGIEVDPAEQLRRNVEAWNQQVALIDAEQKMRRADILFKRAEIEAKIVIARAELEVARLGLTAREQIVRGEAALVGAEIGILGGLLQALKAADEALAIIEGLIEGLKGMEISGTELDEALGRLGRRGGGGGAIDRTEERRTIDQEIARFDLEDVGTQLADAQEWFDELAKRIQDSFKGAEAVRRLLEAEEELARRREEIARTQMQASGEFIMRGTPLGGPLITGLNELARESMRLQESNRALLASGQLTLREMRELNRAIREAEERQRQAMIQGAGTTLLADLFSFIGEEEKAAEIRYNLTVAELRLRYEELRLAQEIYGFVVQGWDEIGRIMADLPSYEEWKKRQGTPADGGPTPSGALYNARMEREAKAQEEWAQRVRDALATLVSFERRGIDPFLSEILEIQEAFASLREVLGDTERVNTAYARAIADTIREFLAPAREALADMALSEFSPLEAGQRLMEAERQLRNAQISFRSGDLAQMADATRRAPELVQQLLREAQAALPVGSQAYKSMFRWANEVLSEIVAWGDQLGAGDNLTPGDLGPGPLGLVNFDPVITQLQMGQDATTLELIAIRRSSERTAEATEETAWQLATGIKIAGGVG